MGRGEGKTTAAASSRELLYGSRGAVTMPPAPTARSIEELQGRARQLVRAQADDGAYKIALDEQLLRFEIPNGAWFYELALEADRRWLKLSLIDSSSSERTQATGATFEVEPVAALLAGTPGPAGEDAPRAARLTSPGGGLSELSFRKAPFNQLELLLERRLPDGYITARTAVQLSREELGLIKAWLGYRRAQLERDAAGQ